MGDRRLTTVRLVAVISVALALMCAYVVSVWAHDHRQLECYRDQAEEGLVASPNCER